MAELAAGAAVLTRAALLTGTTIVPRASLSLLRRLGTLAAIGARTPVIVASSVAA
jgi:hypothetical protein